MTHPLERLIAEAKVLAGGDHPCSILGHKWESDGGCNAGCSDNCGCSAPVNKCQSCGDYDYGDNADAEDIRADCQRRRASQN